MQTELGVRCPPGTSQLAGKYLAFRLQTEAYAVSVLKVREIIRLTPITPVPQMPPHVRGVINLRGRIIPVLDLRARFGLTTASDSAQNCIMVVQVRLAEDKHTAMGLIVDSVEEVVNIPADDIEAAPDFGPAIPTDYILGMAKGKSEVKTLLDLDGLLAAAELNLITRQTPTTSLSA